MIEPYVSEKVSWAIRYHQALRFYPDEPAGCEYPEMYDRILGKDYVPAPHIKAAYTYARNHKWYMNARLITVNDLYAFDPNAKVSIEPFIDIIGRHFKQPQEGLRNDNWVLYFSNKRSISGFPIFQFQPRDAAELARVVSDQSQSMLERDGGDLQDRAGRLLYQFVLVRRGFQRTSARIDHRKAVK